MQYTSNGTASEVGMELLRGRLSSLHWIDRSRAWTARGPILLYTVPRKNNSGTGLTRPLSYSVGILAYLLLKVSKRLKRSMR